MILDNYTEEQILNFSDEEVEKIINLHLAENGIKLLKCPKEPEYNELPKHDKVIYSVEGFKHYFEKRETAEEMKKLIRNNFSQLKQTDYSYDSDYKRVISVTYGWGGIRNINDVKIEDTLVYSDELYNEIAGKVEANKKLKEDYTIKKKEYDENNEIARDIKQEIYDKIYSVKDKYSGFENMKRRFNEYLELADGVEETAWKFLKKAYTISNECEDFIKASLSSD